MGAALLRWVDESLDGTRSEAFELRLVSERISLRELIQRRIEFEVSKHNSSPQKLFRGLVQPSDTERELNGYRLKKPRRLDAAKQTLIALESFEQNGFFVLFDDRQVESLDDELVLVDNSLVSFVRLMPLVGG